MGDWYCPECGTEYEDWVDSVLQAINGDGPDCCTRLLPTDGCDCYKCAGPEYEETEYGEMLVNNMEYHTYGEPCLVCGTERTEYKDLGTKGRYVCPHQSDHSAEQYANAE